MVVSDCRAEIKSSRLRGLPVRLTGNRRQNGFVEMLFLFWSPLATIAAALVGISPDFNEAASRFGTGHQLRVSGCGSCHRGSGENQK